MTNRFTAESFLSVVRKSELIAPDQLKRLLEEFRQRGVDLNDPQRLADELVAAEALTRWQADKLLQGKHHGFFLGKYRLLSLLGKGGMSSVYLAEHVLMRRRCAIKVLPTRRVNDTSYLGRFHREAQAVASLDHSNIVRAYDVDQETQKNSEIHFLVMEYVEGRSLLEMVQKDGPLDFVSAADYVRQSAEGLAHAHAAGMVHRDVKPGNLLVESSGTVKILDLGLARFFRNKEDKSLTVAHDEKVLGTADYLAPEQARDSHGVDARADIYSLGCTFYFLLTGHPPFPEGTLAQRLLAHQFRDPPPVTDDRPDTPAELVAIVEQMMAKDVDQRFQSSQEVADALAAWLNDNAGEEWRRKHPGLSGSGSDLGRTANPPGPPAAGRAASPPPSAARPSAAPSHGPGGPGARRAGTVKGDTAIARDSSTEKSGAESRKTTRREVPLPQPAAAATATATADDDDSALAMFLSKLPAEAPPVAKPAPAHGVTAAVPVARPASGAETAVAGNAPRTAPVVGRGPRSEETLIEAPALQLRAEGAAAEEAAADRPVAALPVAGASPAATRTPPAPVAAPAREPSRSRWSTSPAVPAALGVLLLAGVLYAVFASGGGETPADTDAQAAEAPAAPDVPERDPRKLLGKDIHVGPAGAFKTLGEAIAYVHEHFEPATRRDAQTIRVAGGLSYPERIHLSGGEQEGERGRPFPRGVNIVCTDQKKAVLDPVGDEPVVKLDDVQRFTLAGFEIRGHGRRTAVELTGFLEGTQLKDLEIAGFGETGLLGRSARGALRNELVFERIVFRDGGPSAAGVRLDEGSRLQITNCRFLPPLRTGLVITKEALYVDLQHSVFANVNEGLRFAGSPFLKNVTLVHNTFYHLDRGIVFAGLPADSSSDLAFHRNLFDGIAAAEALVEAGYDQRRFERMWPSGGLDQNWTTREAASGEGVADLFSTGGRQGVEVRYVSTDPANPKFLAPAPDSPQGNVPAPRPSGLRPFVGAVGP